MSIERRQTKRGAVYDVRLRTPDRRQLSKTFRTKHEAESFERHQLTDLSRGAWIDPRGESVSFGEWALEWLARDPSKRPSTLARDESILRNHLLPALGRRALGTVTPRDVQRLVNEWAAANAPSSVRRQYDVLRAIFAAAVDLDMIGRSPCRSIRLPAKQKLERRIPSAEDLGFLAVEIGKPWDVMVWLGALLGLRWGECAGLRVGRVDFNDGRIHVVEQVTRARHGLMVAGPPKSEAGSRSLSASVALLALLAARVAELGERGTLSESLLFSEADGGLLDYSNWRHRVWVPACKRSGLGGLVFHDLRRVNATVLVSEGIDLKTAQTRLGHSDPRLTLAVYAQASTTADRDAADRIARRLLS